MLLPHNTLKQSEYNLLFRHINKSMTLTLVTKWNWGGIVENLDHYLSPGSMEVNLSMIKEKLSLKSLAKNIPKFSIKCLSL